MNAPIEAGAGRQTMNIVIVGHVDHGKSTLVGRLLADTGVLGDGKLEKVIETCRRQGKVFEYAFLLDALEAEQDQGITIDAARVFFRTDRRDYIIIDAPGHVEFLKNMVTGAARAEAAILLIDAKEGVRENSRRHGYLLSMLGIRQVVVAVNKMDLVDNDKAVFDRIETEYRAFLAEVGIEPQYVIPISGRNGDHIARRSESMGWYQGPTVLTAVDEFAKQPGRSDLALRMPVQDVYKFNEQGDDRRIIAGRIESGTLRVGDKVVFSPSNKTATVQRIEAFAADLPSEVSAGRCTGVTMSEELYVRRGEIMSHVDSQPQVSSMFRVNLFWLGRAAMDPSKSYKLKLATAQSEVRIHQIHRVLDANDLGTSVAKTKVERHDVADLVLVSRQPIAFDSVDAIEATGRFVIVDDYNIAGGGIVRELVQDGQQQLRLASQTREVDWVHGDVSPSERAELYGHPASLVMFTGDAGVGKHAVARALEARLAHSRHCSYLLDGKNVFLGGEEGAASAAGREELVRRFADVAYLFLDAGLIVVSTTNAIGLGDHRAIGTLIAPHEMLIVHLGAAPKLVGDVDVHFDANVEVEQAVDRILLELARRERIRRDLD